MNILPAVGFGLLFLFVAKGNKIERRNALKEGATRTVYNYGSLPDIIGDLTPEEAFVINLPIADEKWLLKATPPNDEVVLEEKIVQGSNYMHVFRAKRRGKGAIVFHRAVSEETEPLEVVEINVEVV